MNKKELTQRWINILVTLILVLFVYGDASPFLTRGRGCPMSISQTSAGQKIDFGNLAATGNLTTFSAGMWINPSSYAPVENASWQAAFFSQVGNSGATWSGWGLYVDNAAYTTEGLYLFIGFSGDDGAWKVANVFPDLNVWYYVELQFDGTTPRVVINGVTASLTAIQAPTGTYAPAATSYPLVTGNVYAGGTYLTYQGLYTNPRIWNRQRTAAQALQTYELRQMHDDINGLVFAPMMYGASGLQAFDGATLAAGNKIVDPYSGAYGTPAGNPIGRAETYLIACP